MEGGRRGENFCSFHLRQEREAELFPPLMLVWSESSPANSEKVEANQREGRGRDKSSGGDTAVPGVHAVPASWSLFDKATHTPVVGELVPLS